jgi:predicted branched-subunit amino acid permease
MSVPAPESTPPSSASGFVRGFAASGGSVYLYVLFGTFIGIGALGHDFGFSLFWMLLSTLLVWAAPAQVILISALGTGTGPVEAAIAVALSGVRLLPMVVALLPMLRTENTRTRELVLPAHFTAISMWVENLRLLPGVPREQRVAFSNGLSCGLVLSAALATAIGFYLAGNLPPLYAAALLFLTPLSFTLSLVRNSILLADRLAFAFGLVLAPILAALNVGLDLLWSGIAGGTLAYGIYRLRKGRR